MDFFPLIRSMHAYVFCHFDDRDERRLVLVVVFVQGAHSPAQSAPGERLMEQKKNDKTMHTKLKESVMNGYC